MGQLELGFVGLGRMGNPMLARLIEAGHPVHVYDRSDAAMAVAVQRGGVAVGSAAAVADAADIVLISLPTPDVVHQVCLGTDGLAAGRRARIVIDLSTTGPRTAAAVAAAFAATGQISFVDSPVSGGVAGAEAGKLALMVACPKAIFAEVETLLAHFGRLFFVGETPGMGQTLKLVNNLLSAAALAITSEGMAMGVKAGLDPQVMIDVINVSSGRNSAIADKFPRAVLSGNFDFGFATGLSHKDVRLCVDEAESLGVPMVVGSAVRQILTVTEAVFGADSDCTCTARLLEQWAGVEMRRRAG